MTDEAKFMEVLKVLGKTIADLNWQIELDKSVIESLKKKLEKAEQEDKQGQEA